MRVIRATNVNDAYSQGLTFLHEEGVREESRAGPVLVVPYPVVTAYEAPWERVLFDPLRDANPFFHLFESLWMLSGNNDARWLDRFVHDFSSRFAEEGGRMHGAYGFRWRQHFDVEGGGSRVLPDQLDTIVALLRDNPDDRRVVLTMWDPAADLAVDKRDVPCNTQAYLRVRRERRGKGWGDESYPSVLDLTVCCRSNDAIWGAYGANAVHFSMLQEYLAGRIGVGVGKYYQISNNFHGYVNALEKVGVPVWGLPYPGVVPIGQDWSCWDEDLARFMAWTESEEPDQEPQEYPQNPWFGETAEPLFVAYHLWKRGDREHALWIVTEGAYVWPSMAPDWRQAVQEWMQRRM